MKNTLVVCSISFMLMVLANYIFFATGGRNLGLFVLQIVTIINLVYQLAKLAKKLAKPIAAKIRKSRLGRLVLLLFETIAKIGANATGKVKNAFAKFLPNPGPLLKRYSDERSIISTEKTNLNKKLRKMRWRSLTDNRQRVRFHYIAYIRKELKQGAPISPSDTPTELHEKLTKIDKKPNSDLFNLYNLARYNENSEISDRDVELVK